MSDTQINLDDGLLREFLDESIEALHSLDELFVRLEADPTDLDNVNTIFRPVHSIKGNSAFFGLIKVKSLAHELETLLDMVRKETLQVSPALIDILLQGMDQLKAMLASVHAGQPEIDDHDHFDTLLQNVKNAGTATSSDEQIWTRVLQSIQNLLENTPDEIQQITEQLKSLGNDLKTICPHNQSAESADQNLPQPVNTILSILTGEIEDKLDNESAQSIGEALREIADLVADHPEATDLTQSTLDSYNTFMDALGFDALLGEIILENLNKIIGLNPFKQSAPDESARTPDKPEPQTSETPNQPQQKTPDASQAAPQNDASKTMRIAESQIDMFLEFVGELLVVNDMYAYLEQCLADNTDVLKILSDFRRANQTFGTLSNNLQTSIMSIRKVPVRALLQKVPRLVRDIASASGKSITVNIEGETTEVDKSLIDMLDAPLTHMVRNAADHGIEMPDQRAAAGKPETGTINVTVEELDNFIEMTIQDDGAGLNYDAIAAKAEKIGLVKPGQKLTKADVIEFLFKSGVSTADQITDISGRGVGMDVVKRMIDDAGGAVDVKSKAGKGATFTVALPKSVTTQIMEGYLVAAGQHRYVLPMNKVCETANIPNNKFKTVVGKGKCVVKQDKILPSTSLRTILNLGPELEKEEHIVVTVNSNKSQTAMIVDDVLGVQKVVLRQIDGLETSGELIVGGALMGDGSIALILNPDNLTPDFPA